jgi:hypothetical protein
MQVGRPLKYKTPEEMQEVIDKYFADNRYDTDSGIVKRYTMSGLALALGMDRRTLVDYAHRDEFLPTVKSARQEVENCLEEHLFGNGVTGVIFNLKNNFGWKDKTEQELSGSLEVKAIEYQVCDPQAEDS